jgi:hypothetical protein
VDFATKYTRIKAYGNHYKVSTDTHGITMVSYDSGKALIFQQQQQSCEGTTFGLV